MAVDDMNGKGAARGAPGALCRRQEEERCLVPCQAAYTLGVGLACACGAPLIQRKRVDAYTCAGGFTLSHFCGEASMRVVAKD